MNYGHRTPDPTTPSYSGLVLCGGIRIAMTYAAIMGLGFIAAVIRNGYPQSPTSEKRYVIFGTYFGLDNVGKL